MVCSAWITATGDLKAPSSAYEGSKRAGEGVTLNERVKIYIGYMKETLPMRVVRPWTRLPREAVAVPCLEVLKARLDMALGNLV